MTSPSVLHVLRLTVEAVTPISSSSGESLMLQDNVLARDANGLPILLGPSVAGVLRHVHEDHFGEEETARLFGHEHHGTNRGSASLLEVSHGFVHDSRNKPVWGRLDPAALRKDAICALLSQSAPLRRDGVALDPCGVAREHQKFERVGVPIGTRFTLELMLESWAEQSEADQRHLLQVASLFRCSYLRFGGATRRGFGKIRLVEGSIHHAAFDRAAEDGWNAYADWRRRPIFDPGPAYRPAGDLPPLPSSSRQLVSGRVTLDFEGWWRFGQGMRPIGVDDTTPDQLPVTEAMILYSDTGGTLGGLGENGCWHVPVAASGIKGALAHRAEFEFNRLQRNWVEIIGPRPTVRFMDALFGSTKAGRNGGEAGLILIDDARVEVRTELAAKTDDPQVGFLAHNSLDRFTQGVRNRILFSEQSLWGGRVEFDFCILRHWDEETDQWVDPDDRALLALARALNALVQGRLALGADSGDGHGYCKGSITGDLKTWLDEKKRGDPC